MPDWNASAYDQYQPEEERHNLPRTRHQALGIISFVLSLLSITVSIAMFALAVISIAANGKPGPHSGMTFAVGLCMCSTPALGLVGLGLGIGSMFQRGPKVFGILGIVFNAILFLGSILFFIVALALGAAASNRKPAPGGGQAGGTGKIAFCTRSLAPFIS
jgi:hypothetical protein